MYDELAKRMKEKYERATKFFLPLRSFQVMRVDGKAFHTYTRKLDKPHDKDFQDIMNEVMLKTFKQIQSCIFAYRQSDEINFILTDLKGLNSQTYFDGKVQKMASISASTVTATYASVLSERLRTNVWSDFSKKFSFHFPTFDSRVFSIPSVEEVGNYLIWRQLDAERNWISGWCQSVESHKKLDGLGRNDQIKLLEKEGIDWNTDGYKGYEVDLSMDLIYPSAPRYSVLPSKSFRKDAFQTENPIYRRLKDMI